MISNHVRASVGFQAMASAAKLPWHHEPVMANLTVSMLNWLLTIDRKRCRPGPDRPVGPSSELPKSSVATMHQVIF